VTVFFKCENFQRTGSFKYRGAVNAIASLSPDAFWTSGYDGQYVTIPVAPAAARTLRSSAVA
jgi:threonine dehydratase